MSKEIDTTLNEESSAATTAAENAATAGESLSYENLLAQVAASMNPVPVVRYEPMVQQGRVFLVKDVLKSLRNEKPQTQ